jgi:hypothetical protein
VKRKYIQESQATSNGFLGGIRVNKQNSKIGEDTNG